MERPFDTTGNVMEPTGFDYYKLRKGTNRLNHCGGDGGASILSVFFCYAPDWWTNEEVTQAVRFHYPSEHFQHSYDCCGRMYARTAHVVEIIDGHIDPEGDKGRLVIVRQSFIQNV